LESGDPAPAEGIAAPDLETLLAEGRWDEAEALARRLLALGARDPAGHAAGVCAMARIGLGRGETGAMRRWLDRAARIMDNDGRFREFRASLLIAAGEAEAALSVLEAPDATDHSPGLAEATILAAARWQTGRRAQASELVEALLRRSLLVPTLAGLADLIVLGGGWPGWVASSAGVSGAGLRAGGNSLQGALLPDLGAKAELEIAAEDGRVLAALPVDRFLSRYGRPGPSGTGPSGAGLAGFAFPLPDDSAGNMSVAIDGRPLLGSGLSPAAPPAVEGIVEIEGSTLRGWAGCPDLPDLRIAVRVTDGSDSCSPTLRRRTTPRGETRQVFSLDLTECGLAPGRIAVTAGPHDRPLTGSPLFWEDRGLMARAAVDLAVWLRDGGPRPALLRRADTAAMMARRLRYSPLPVLPPPARPDAAIPAAAPRVDVIVPVYGGRQHTLDCLASVLATLPADAELVVIDDATPDAALAAELDTLAAAGRLTLLRNDTNRGFPAAANRGMALHPERDVVLLNADTLVFGDWLARLRKAAYAAADAGTVTPLSNDATICTYPTPKPRRTSRDAEPPMPPPAELAAVDRVARRVNAGAPIELPTAVGFCMYVRRDCLAETGDFSEDLFGRGYGEENDFCLRARRLGWRHYAAADVYVAHVGGQSFGRQRQLLQDRNAGVLERLHPGYHALIGRFHAADPLAVARRRLDRARWRAGDRRPALLVITLDLEGGVAAHVDERCRKRAAEGWRVLALVPAAPLSDAEAAADAAPRRRCRLVDRERPELRDLVFDTAAEMYDLVRLLRRAGVAEIEIHHSLNHHPAVLSLPRRLSVPYDVVAHDYHWICPRITLIGVSARYCDEPDLAACERCALTLGAEAGMDADVVSLRRRSGEVLAAARRVIAPCHDVATRLRRYFPDIEADVKPWDAVRPTGPKTISRHARPCAGHPRSNGAGGTTWMAGSEPGHDEQKQTAGGTPHLPLRVCVVGAIGPHKGYDVLLGCARDAAARDLPLEFVLVGYSCDDGPLFSTGRVFITGRYEEDEAEALVGAQAAGLAFLPSLCPETWCYSLSLAWRAGLPVVAFDLGAQAERIRTADGGWLLPLDLGPAAINDALLAFGDKSMINRQPSSPSPDCSKDRSMAPVAPSAPPQITATTQLIGLPQGFYSVTVNRGGRAPRPGQLPLPAVQLVVPPDGVSPAAVEILSSLPGGWLTRQGDTILLKVGADAAVLMTSYKDGASAGDALDIQISRVDGAHQVVGGAALALPKAGVLAHIQTLGNQMFGPDAAAVAPGLWIEAFGVMPMENLTAEDIEYKAVTATGSETPWMSGGSLCGTVGMGQPLIGFAVRLRGPLAERVDCQYEGSFLGGRQAAPCRNGQLCRADALGAPLEGIRLSFAPKG
jgi:GT2 family glycosyltransferase/glycosyltransferase involved in cell wall biosynthesis